jgi:hypothetical protein
MLGIVRLCFGKMSALCLLKSPINARSFFNIHDLPDAAARSGASELKEKSRGIIDLANFCLWNFFLRIRRADRKRWCPVRKAERSGR